MATAHLALQILCTVSLCNIAHRFSCDEINVTSQSILTLQYTIQNINRGIAMYILLVEP